MTNPTNAVPAPIGPVHYSEARAVLARDPESATGSHSAVYGSLSVYTDSVKQTQLILSRWNEIMTAAANMANEILQEVTVDG